MCTDVFGRCFEHKGLTRLYFILAQVVPRRNLWFMCDELWRHAFAGLHQADRHGPFEAGHHHPSRSHVCPQRLSGGHDQFLYAVQEHRALSQKEEPQNRPLGGVLPELGGQKTLGWTVWVCALRLLLHQLS